MPFLVPAAIVGGAAISGIAGNAAASKQADAAQAARDNAIAQFLSLHVPDPAQQKVIYQQYKQTGQLSPQMEEAFQQSQTELGKIQLDPADRQAQVNALTKLQDISSHGGLDAQAEQGINQTLNQTNANEKGQRGAIVQNFAQRGVGGSGAQLAAQLSASQGDANQAAASGLSIQAQAQQRALQALTQSSAIGSNLESQDYSQAAAKAAAQDAINRFNTQNQQTVTATNTKASNDAAAANLANEQSIDNANVGLTNAAENKNQGLYQQQYEDQLQQAAGASGQYAGKSDLDQKQSQQTAQQWANIGAAVSQGAAAYGKYASSDNTDDSEEE